MVEKGKTTIDDLEYKTFTILNDGFIPSGFVQMECRLSDMDNEEGGEGEAFFISVHDNVDQANRDYAPLEMDKNELGQFIEYLKECYNELP